MNPIRVLYVTSATDPFLQRPPLSTHVKELSETMAASPACDVRLLAPRFGVIKERPNNIHETIRLSGINIPMGKDRISLVVKVPSVRGVKIPIYFVDNEELFERKGVFTDAKKGHFYEDNDIRSLFFCKSVLAIIEKLAWIPHIIHCHGWFSSFIPVFLKKAYTESHPLRHTKSIYTLYEDSFDHQFSQETLKYVRYKQLKTSDLESALSQKVGYDNLTNLAMTHADQVTRTFEKPESPIWEAIPYQKADYVPCDPDAEQTYLSLYESLQAK